VSSRRALRADPAFDKIIQTFYPDIDAYEEKEEQFISRVNAESHSMANAIEEGLRRQVHTNTNSAPSPRSGLVSAREFTSCSQRLGVRIKTHCVRYPLPSISSRYFCVSQPFPFQSRGPCVCVSEVSVSVPFSVLDAGA
jgi:hypothetical protein